MKSNQPSHNLRKKMKASYIPWPLLLRLVTSNRINIIPITGWPLSRQWGNVKFPDGSLTFCSTPTHATFMRPQPKPCFHILYMPYSHYCKCSLYKNIQNSVDWHWWIHVCSFKTTIFPDKIFLWHFPDNSLTIAKFPDISRFSRKVVTLYNPLNGVNMKQSSRYLDEEVVLSQAMCLCASVLSNCYSKQIKGHSVLKLLSLWMHKHTWYTHPTHPQAQAF